MKDSRISFRAKKELRKEAERQAMRAGESISEYSRRLFEKAIYEALKQELKEERDKLNSIVDVFGTESAQAKLQSVKVNKLLNKL